MNVHSRRAVGLCGLAAIAGCWRPAQSHREVSPAHPYVVMVSFDAFRHDYIDRFHPPAFMDVAARGVRASALIPSFPSKTFPNHYTLATGLYPGHHGITGNAFYDPARGQWYRLADTTA
ncbi:MAG: alkaline phosphatase family protein, partial [Gemmatimonadota bacterium]|nr:alkaline phosphatase family protein [Gemmatimonadota bacterium]